MIVESLDHVNIRTPAPAETVRFFVEILDMTHRPPPGMPDESVGSWLYDRDDRPIIHVGGPGAFYPSDDDYPFAGGQGSALLHHVALRCEGYEGVTQRLEDAGLRFSENLVPVIGLRQLFVAELNGILLELNFFDS